MYRRRGLEFVSYPFEGILTVGNLSPQSPGARALFNVSLSAGHILPKTGRTRVAGAIADSRLSRTDRSSRASAPWETCMATMHAQDHSGTRDELQPRTASRRDRDLLPRSIRLLVVLRADVWRRLELEHLGVLGLDGDHREVALRPLDVLLLLRVVLPSAMPSRAWPPVAASYRLDGRQNEGDSPTRRPTA